jgi:hypothetical protein
MKMKERLPTNYEHPVSGKSRRKRKPKRKTRRKSDSSTLQLELFAERHNEPKEE